MDFFKAIWGVCSGPFLAWVGFRAIKEMHSHKTMAAVGVIIGAGLVWWFSANPESFMNIIGGVVGKIITWLGDTFKLKG